MYTLCQATYSTQRTQLASQLSNITTVTTGQITIYSENAVWPPEDGCKDARNMLRNKWLTIKSLIFASSWSHIYLLINVYMRSVFLSTTVPALSVLKGVIIRADVRGYTLSQNLKTYPYLTKGKPTLFFVGKTRQKEVGWSLSWAGGWEGGWWLVVSCVVGMARRLSVAEGVKNATLTCEPSFLQFNPLPPRV